MLSAVQTHVYTVAPPPTGFTVYFKKPAAWQQAWIHYWGASPTAALANCVWPCQQMTAHTSPGWYKKQFTGITATNLLFHNNAGLQSPDFVRSATGWYDNGTWTATEPGTTYTMDGAVDAVATPIALNNGVTLWVHASQGKLYIATQSGQSYGNKDVFVFVSSNPNGMTAAPWNKTGQVAGNCKLLTNEGTNTYAGWSGTTAATTSIASANIVEGTLNIATEFGSLPPTLYLAVGVYGTNNAENLYKQCPAAVVANNNIEATEFVAYTLPTMLLVSDNDTEANNDAAMLLRESAPANTTVAQTILYDAVPNPFAHQTALTFSLRKEQTVLLQIFDAQGKLVETLQQGALPSGTHQFVWDATDLPNGLYYYQLQTNTDTYTRKLVVSK